MTDSVINGIDLTVMVGAHAAFRRDLAHLARAAEKPETDPARLLAVANGWTTFKRQLLNHHQMEDQIIWPRLRERFDSRPEALSVLDEMEHEHGFIDPLLAAADEAFAAGDPGRGDVLDELVGKLSAHLEHEERDALRLIGEAITPAQWQQANQAMMARPGVMQEVAPEMFAWILEDADEEQVAKVFANLPPFVGAQYKQQWKAQYEAVSRW